MGIKEREYVAVSAAGGKDSAFSYRFAFNGKEQDNEVSGSGNSYDFGARIYDARLGMWMSKDPITKPWCGRYTYASDNPVNFVDPDGQDEIHFYFTSTLYIDKDGAFYKTTTEIKIIETGDRNHKFIVHYDKSGDGSRVRSTTTLEPFQPNYLIANQTKYNASRNSLPMAAPVQSIFGNYPIDDYVYLGRLLQLYPELVNYIGDDDFAWKRALSGASKTAQSYDFGEKVLEASETAYLMAEGYLFIRAAASYLVRKVAISAQKYAVYGLKNSDNFVMSASAMNRNGLNNAAKQLQKHAGREGGAFADIKFSHKTANIEGLKQIDNILNAEVTIVKEGSRGGKVVYDAATGRGVAFGRGGKFNGFRELGK